MGVPGLSLTFRRARPSALTYKYPSHPFVHHRVRPPLPRRAGAHVFNIKHPSVECSLRDHARINTTFNNGSLGSRIDEERSEMRYVM